MSKKLISLLLAICMLFCLSACGTTATSNNSTDTPSESQTDTVKDNDENTFSEENNQVSSNTEETNKNDTQTQPSNNQSKPTSTTNQPTHNHSYSNATCTSPKKCSCGVTAGTALGHQFSSATCTSPQICSRCGTTSGNALGHSYSSANCNSPKTCTRCGQTSGSALGHNYVNNKCSRCGKVDPDSLPVSLFSIAVIDSFDFRKDEGSFTDSFGNAYNNALRFNYVGRKNTHSIFNLDNKYSKLSGSIVTYQDTDSEAKMIVEIYVDDVLKYKSNPFGKTTGKIDFSVDVKNAQKLLIKGVSASDTSWQWAHFAIVNAQLTK